MAAKITKKPTPNNTRTKTKGVKSKKTATKKPPSVTKSSNENFSKFLLTIIIFLSVIVLVGAFLIYKNESDYNSRLAEVEMMEESRLQTSEPEAPNLVTDINVGEVAESSTPEWTGEITLAPLNIEDYDKTTGEDVDEFFGNEDFLCGIDDAVYYKNANYEISIINENLRNEKNSFVFDYISNYYELGEKDRINPGKVNRSLFEVFDYSCVGRGYLLDQGGYISEIFESEEFDGYRVIFDSTQNYVLAKKGKDYILINIKSELPLQKQMVAECNVFPSGLGFVDEAVECFEKEYSVNGELRNELLEVAKTAIKEVNIQSN